MKQKTLFIICVFLALTVNIFAQRTHMAGVFPEAVHIEGGDKRDLRADENIVFGDTALADLDLDGHEDRISRKDGLQLAFWVNDSTSRDVQLSKEDGKIAIYDVNGDGFLDILQQTGFGGGGLLLYQNSAMQLLSSRMIPVSEDGEGFYEYNNFTDSSKISYFPGVSTGNIRLETARNGIKVYPVKDWHGSAELTIAYHDSTFYDTVHCPILVMPVNDAPVFSEYRDSLFLNEDESLDIFTDSLLALASDPDSGDVLRIYPVGGRKELSGSDSISTYRPAANWHGDDSLAFVVSDGELSDTLILKLRVRPVNDAPQWTQIAEIEFPEDEYVQLPLSLFREHVSDIETPDSLLRFHVFSGKHVVISTEGGRITLLGDRNWFGRDELIVTVSDGELSDTLIWPVNITPVNDAPELAELPDTLFYEDGEININKSELEKFAFDVETSSRNLKWQVKRFGKVRAFYNGVYIHCSASPDWYGTDSLMLTVSDGELSASRIWKVHVLPVNDAPRFLANIDLPRAKKGRIPARVFLEDDTLTIKKTELYKMARDPETASRDLDWSLFPSPSVNIAEDENAYYLYAGPNWFGDAHVQVVVSDGEYKDTLKQNVRVMSVNDKPTIQKPEAGRWNEDDTLGIDMSYLESLAYDVETKKHDLMWHYIPNDYIKVKQRKTGITLIPKQDWNGETQLGLIVYDGGLRDTGYMDIKINPVNDAPRWLALPDTSIDEDASLTLPLSYIGSFAYDPDEGDKITLDYKAGKNFYVEEKQDTIVLWPMEDWYGKEKLELTAGDGKKKVKYIWNITVRSVNDPPYFTMGLPDSLTFSANRSDTLLFEDIVYDVDNKIEDLVWEVTPGRIVRSTIDEKLGGIIFFSDKYKYGQDAVNIRVTDGHNQIVYYLPILVKEVDRFLMSNPEKLELLPNTPNPFTEYTDIRYSLPVPANVSIKIYNLLGKEIKTLASGHHDAQNHSVRWWGETDYGQPAPSGVYLCRMVSVIDGEPVIMMQKMMLVR